ncbi:hypothetical protein D3C77_386960 [compost metagenome]
MSQLLGRRVHVVDTALDIRGDHTVADRLQGNLRPLLLHFQGAGEGLPLGQQLARSHPGQDYQPQRGCKIGHYQNPREHSRTLAQRVAERSGSRCHTLVDLGDARLAGSHRAGIYPA